MGVPVVTTPAGSEGLQAESGRDLLVGETPAELAQQIIRVLQDPSQQRELAQRGRRYVERHHQWQTRAPSRRPMAPPSTAAVRLRPRRQAELHDH